MFKWICLILTFIYSIICLCRVKNTNKSIPIPIPSFNKIIIDNVEYPIEIINGIYLENCIINNSFSNRNITPIKIKKKITNNYFYDWFNKTSGYKKTFSMNYFDIEITLTSAWIINYKFININNNMYEEITFTYDSLIIN